MKNVLIDQNCKWLVNEDSKKHLENYDKIFVVGIDLKQRDYDETLATFCKDNDCELLTADNRAYIHFFSEKKSKMSNSLNSFMKIKQIGPSTLLRL